MLLTSSFLYDIIILIITIGVSLYYYLTKNHDYWKKRGMPYIEPVPFFGNMLDIFTSKKVVGTMFQDFYNSMNTPYLGFFLMGRPSLLITDLQLVKNILIRDFNNFPDRHFAHRENSFGAYMFSLMRGDEWKLYRKKLGPGFSRIKQSYDLIKAVGNDFEKYLEKEVKNCDLISVKTLGEMWGLEVITSMGMGAQADCFSKKDSEFLAMASKLFNLDNIVRAFSLTSYLMFPSLVNVLKLNIMDPGSEAFLYGLFQGTWEIRKNNTNYKRSDFVDALMKLERDDKELNLDFNKLATQAIAFFIGGYETTSVLVSTALYELAKNPDKQTKLRNEIRRKLEETKDGQITYEMLTGELKYLEMVIKETLRMYPPLPMLNRVAQEDYPIPGTNYVIEKGTPVFIPMYGFHMDPKYFPNPEVYIPERFSEENIKKIVPFSYMPFGDGPRICPGEKIGMLNDMLAVAIVIKNYEISLRNESQRQIEFYTKSTILMPKPEKMVLRFKKLSL